MRIVRAAALAALAASLSGTALADDPPRRTVDRNIEKAAARIAAEKLGELRGLILEDIQLDYRATGDVGGETRKPPRPPAPAPKGEAGGAKQNKLPPIVDNNLESFDLNPFATHSIFRSDDGRERVSMIFGAHRTGNPAPKHLPRLD